MTDETKKRRGRTARRKGGMFELEVVRNHTEVVGVPAAKVPLSGASEGYLGDVKVEVLGGLLGECKARKGGAGFTTLERWMGKNDILFLKRDRQAPMVVLSWEAYAAMAHCTHLSEAVDSLIISPGFTKRTFQYQSYEKLRHAKKEDE